MNNLWLAWVRVLVLKAAGHLADLARDAEGDVLLYCDIGCHLNPKGLKRLEEYRQQAIEQKYFGVDDNREVVDWQVYEVLQRFSVPVLLPRYDQGEELVISKGC